MTQDDLKEMTKEAKSVVEKSARAVSNKMSSKLIGLSKKVITGKICISYESEQNLDGNIKMGQITDVYHLGDRNLKMTVSYNLAEAQTYKPIVNKIRNSLVIK